VVPLTGWLAGRFGIKYVFGLGRQLHAPSALCGAATALRLVLFRALQGWRGRADPAVTSDPAAISPPERPGHAWQCSASTRSWGRSWTALGWLTQDYSWRWIFCINLPIGALCTLGILIFIRQTTAPQAVRFLRVSDAEPGDRRCSDARPRRVEGLVSFERDLDRAAVAGWASIFSPCTR
jgi:DHA2 family multidrug resistance protein